MEDFDRSDRTKFDFDAPEVDAGEVRRKFDDIGDEAELGEYDAVDETNPLETYNSRGSNCDNCGFAAEQQFGYWTCPKCEALNED